MAAAAATSRNVEHYVGDLCAGRAFVFDERPLSQQVVSVCEFFGEPYDDEQEYRVLTHGVGNEALPLISEDELLALPPHSLLGLHRGSEIAEARVRALEAAAEGEAGGPLRAFFAAVNADSRIAEEAVERGALGAVLAVAAASTAGAATLELAMACICAILCYCQAAALVWLGPRQEELGPEFFSRIFAALFPPDMQDNCEDARNAGMLQGAPPPRASLTVCLFLLHMLPGCAAAAAQAAAHGARRDSELVDGSEFADVLCTAAYPRILGAMAGDLGTEFQSAAAAGVMCALAGAVANQDHLRARVRKDLVSLNFDEDELEALFTRTSRDGHLIEQLLALSSSACAELSISSGRDFVRHADCGDSLKVLHLQEKVEYLEMMLKKEQTERNRLHEATRAMAPFVRVESSLLVEQSLNPITELGWTNVQWKDNYTLLHLAADCLHDPPLIRMLAAFAEDLEQPDDFGMRPIDYARRSGDDDVVEALEALRRQRSGRRRRSMEENCMLSWRRPRARTTPAAGYAGRAATPSRSSSSSSNRSRSSDDRSSEGSVIRIRFGSDLTQSDASPEWEQGEDKEQSSKPSPRHSRRQSKEGPPKTPPRRSGRRLKKAFAEVMEAQLPASQSSHRGDRNRAPQKLPSPRGEYPDSMQVGGSESSKPRHSEAARSLGLTGSQLEDLQSAYEERTGRVRAMTDATDLTDSMFSDTDYGLSAAQLMLVRSRQSMVCHTMTESARSEVAERRFSHVSHAESEFGLSDRQIQDLLQRRVSRYNLDSRRQSLAQEGADVAGIDPDDERFLALEGPSAGRASVQLWSDDQPRDSDFGLSDRQLQDLQQFWEREQRRPRPTTLQRSGSAGLSAASSMRSLHPALETLEEKSGSDSSSCEGRSGARPVEAADPLRTSSNDREHSQGVDRVASLAAAATTALNSQASGALLLPLSSVAAASSEEQSSAGRPVVPHVTFASSPSVSRTPTTVQTTPSTKGSEASPATPSPVPSFPQSLPNALLQEIGAVLRDGWEACGYPPDGFTPLHLAARTGSADCVALLLEARASIALESRDVTGRRPVDYAREWGHTALHSTLDVGGPVVGREQSTTSRRHSTGGQKPAGRPAENKTGRLDVTRRGIRPAGAPWSPVVDATSVRQRRWSVVHSSEDLGKTQLRARLCRLEEERVALLSERKRLLDARECGLGVMSESECTSCLTQMEGSGTDAVRARLQAPRTTGGMALDGAAAARVMEQLQVMLKVIAATRAGNVGRARTGRQSFSAGKGTGPPGAKGARASLSGSRSQPAAPAADAAAGPPEAPKAPSKGTAPAGKGKAPKGKGKGPAPPIRSPLPKAGPGSKAEERNKPKVVPKVPLKPLWWTRILIGVHVQPGQTIWDSVKEETDLFRAEWIEERFAKNANLTVKKPPKNKATAMKEKSAEVKLLRIINDPQLVVAKEAALRKMPPPHEVSRALLELDDEVITLDVLQNLLQNGCPTVEQVQQLQKLRDEKPNVPLAHPEQYMWILSRIPGYQQRLECWRFLCTYEEVCDRHFEALSRMDQVLSCFRRSKRLPALLGLILAIGNYLNGGTERGQADGFDLETLSKLENIRDAQGKDVRQFILEMFFERARDVAEELVEELRPLWLNIFRQLGKDSDGVEKLKKRVEVTLEDVDVCVNVLASELEKQQAAMEAVLPSIDNPHDKFKFAMPELFAQAQARVSVLSELRSKVKESYANLLGWFKASALKSADFCMLWDNFFVPEGQFVKRKENEKRKLLVPAFCSTNPVSITGLLDLWQLRKDESELRSPTMATSRRRATLFKQKPKPRRSRVALAPAVSSFMSMSSSFSRPDTIRE